jgi:hypothetical protein
VAVTEHADIDLAVFDIGADAVLSGGHRFAHVWEEGLHPMAVANATGCGAVLTRHGRHYRFMYRYESWVQYRSRRPRGRRDLAPLAEALSALEPSGVRWVYDGSAGLAPVLAPAPRRG